LVNIYGYHCLSERLKARFRSPTHLELPSRACGNMIVTHPAPENSRSSFVGKCCDIIQGTFQGRPVFSMDGPFPSDEAALIYIPSPYLKFANLRSVQHSEWVKIKGLGKMDGCTTRQLVTTIEANVWNVLCWTLSSFLGSPSFTPVGRPLPLVSPGRVPSSPKVSVSSATEPPWIWNPPDLAIGSIFQRWKRMASLQMAISTMLPALRQACQSWTTIVLITRTRAPSALIFFDGNGPRNIGMVYATAHL